MAMVQKKSLLVTVIDAATHQIGKNLDSRNLYIFRSTNPKARKEKLT